ncbi:MAG: hypothetical protein RDV41_12710 [Planctomycetota bacterium]|nr:hypothetical protein [Planctomycetota bacterium]
MAADEFVDQEGMDSLEGAAPKNDMITILLIFAFACLVVSIGIAYTELSEIYQF